MWEALADSGNKEEMNVSKKPTRTTYPSYGGYFQTKKEALRHAKIRERYGYAVKIIPKTTTHEGHTYRGYELRESSRPARHTWWGEHLMGESTKSYLARMKKKGLKAYIRNPKRRYVQMAKRGSKKGLLGTKVMGLSLPVLAIGGFILYKLLKKPA